MKKKSLVYLLLCLALLLIGCSNKNKPSEPTNKEPVVDQNVLPTATRTPVEKLDISTVTYEAEDAKLTGKVNVQSAVSGFSGTGYITGIEEDDDTVEFTVNAEKEGFYRLNIRSASLGGEKTNNVLVDGTPVATFTVSSKEFTNCLVENIYLGVGTHTVIIEKSWGWIMIDSLVVSAAKPIDPSIYEVPAKLVNENATDATKRLMSFLTDIYGSYFLSGQYSDMGQYGGEFVVIKKETEKMPAVLGLDFIEYTPSRVENGSTSKATEYAIDYWERGGIPTFCWHWNAPTEYITGVWYSAFYTDQTNIDIEKIMNGQDQVGYDLLIRDIDAIAEQIKVLQDAGVPILWRPLHEASGGWFWWGAKGPEAYKKLYILLYDRLTNHHKLNNLIWVWNGQNKDWYPGDEYVDMIGEDIYPGEQVYTSQINKFLEAVNYTTEKKMVVLSENGCLFDPDLAYRDGAMWGLFATWGGEFVKKGGAIHAISEQYTDREMLKKVYQHDKVLTLDELPDIKTYQIHE